MSLEQELIEIIAVEDLPESFQIVAEICGLETAKKLIAELGGIRIDIPRAKNLRRTIARRLVNEPNLDIRRVAIELNVSVPFIKKLISQYSNK